jgi:hypothetical protein
VQRDERVTRLPYLRDTLRRGQEVGLIEFEFREAPLDAPTPLEGCGELWASRNRRGAVGVDRLKLVAWKAVLSDKAIAAGLQVGQTFLYRRQTLVGIARLVEQEDNTTLVEYSWNWAPTFEGAHLGISASQPVTARATFKRAGSGWRLAR